MFRIPNFFLIWLLVVSTVAAALLPPIVHAYVHDHGVEDACEHTAAVQSGNAFVLALGTANDSDEKESHHEHCPFCTQHHVSAYPATLSTRQNGADAHMAFVPPLYLFARSTLFAWLTPSPRAPPFLS